MHYRVEPKQSWIYGAVHGFWPVVDLAELADEPTGCGKVARHMEFIRYELKCDKVNCAYGETTLDPTSHCPCISDSCLAYCLEIPLGRNHAVHC
jgi:hypothetical protein